MIYDIEPMAGSGYVRSEAAVVLYLQKSKASLRTYATILHARANTDGFKDQGVTYPSGQVQQQLLQEIYTEAGIDPAQVVYVEAHGTGTKAGDPQELNSIAQVFCPGRPPGQPLLIGSVKSNMGHSESASGLCSVAKMIIAMQEGVLPQNLHFKEPNPDIPALRDGRFKVVSENMAWEGGIVGVNSFGFGGANVHVILQSFPKKKEKKVENRVPMLVTFSGRTKDGVQETLKGLSEKVEDLELFGLFHAIAKDDIPGNQFRG